MTHSAVPGWRRRRWLAAVLTVALLGAGLSASAQSADQKPSAGTELDKDHAAKMARGLDLFKKHVRPVLAQRCLRCHGGKEVEANFDMNDRDGLLRGGESGPAILVGKGKQSLLYKLVTHAKEPHMPHNGKKLAPEECEQIAAWIDLGAPYDAPLVAGKGKGSAWTQKVVASESRAFWSFQPLRRPPLPVVIHDSWCRTPLDRFILAKLEAASLNPNPPAGRRQLIRRVYFDLIGLPPTPEEVAAFVNDPAQDAYERLLDRLLKSPHHGERWGRHWLDLVRFAESHGFEHDYDRPTAYHYRDFVIQALNDDLPFDQFVRWQLAGDEFAPASNLALKATGFLAAGVHSTQITKNEVAKHRYEEMDDMLATVGTAMLGLTIGCARCHDHKFDAIPQADYYRLLATFTTTVRSEIDLDLDPAGYQKAKATFEREHEPFVAAVKRFETEQLPGRLATWEKTSQDRPDQPAWVILDVAEPKSAGGAAFTKVADGSLLAGGKNPQQDTYTFVSHTELKAIQAVRLEALADPSLVKGGPGRAANSNFALTTFQVKAAPRDGKGQAIEVKLRNPRATFEQHGLPVRAAIDGDPMSGWAVDPQFGKDHAAVFETETPIGFEGGTILTFVLQFKNNKSHAIGRPRLAVATAAPPAELLAPGVPERILTTLKTPAERRTPEQTAALRRWYRTQDPEWRQLDQAAQEHLKKVPKPSLVKALISSEGLPPVRLHTQGEDFFKETHFLRRGDPEQKDGLATQGFLQVLMPSPAREKFWQEEPPQGWRTSYRRRAFANWLIDVEQGAGRLLARVIVNRLWQRHLGRGIVATPSDFGTRGERPTHPELLDWLATELINHGWRLRPIHKLIMTSSVYLQNSDHDEVRAGKDRDNRLFWRRPRQRLEGEIIRDSLLSVGGLLDARMFGPGTLDEKSKRRSIYFTVKRSQIIPMLQVFDAPDALGGIAERPTTTIAPQALLLMNNPLVRSSARSFARRIVEGKDVAPEQAIGRAYRLALGREPTPDEAGDASEFVRAQAATYRQSGRSDSSELALADFCQTLFCLNEFVYVD